MKQAIVVPGVDRLLGGGGGKHDHAMPAGVAVQGRLSLQAGTQPCLTPSLAPTNRLGRPLQQQRQPRRRTWTFAVGGGGGGAHQRDGLHLEARPIAGQRCGSQSRQQGGQEERRGPHHHL